jgi:hypothetical protein
MSSSFILLRLTGLISYDLVAINHQHLALRASNSLFVVAVKMPTVSLAAK